MKVGNKIKRGSEDIEDSKKGMRNKLISKDTRACFYSEIVVLLSCRIVSHKI